MCFTCGYTGHQSSTCAVVPERQVWNKVIKKLGLRPPNNPQAGTSDSQAAQQVGNLNQNLIDVLQAQARMAAQQQPAPPQQQQQQQQTVRQPGGSTNPFASFPGNPLPTTFPTHGVQAVNRNDATPFAMGSYSDLG